MALFEIRFHESPWIARSCAHALSNPVPLYTNGHHLSCTSPCVNLSDDTVIPDDDEDVNEIAGDNSFATPDRDLSFRIVAFTADAGAYEAVGDCCTGDSNTSGAVDVTDLLNVINTWGNCPTPPAPCLGDVMPNPCHDGAVTVLDLLAVINNWGNCHDDCPGDGSVEGGVPQSYNDCAELCSQYSGTAWQECMQACFLILCEEGQPEYCVED